MIVDALYRASQAGVPIDLWIRGICALRPGVPGLSETIRRAQRARQVPGALAGICVRHRGVRRGGPGQHGEVWLGSPDLMHRNLDRRVEVIVRTTDRVHARELRRLLDLGMDDGTGSWWLDADGKWTRHNRGPGGERLRDIQAMLIGDRRGRASDA